MKKPGIKRQLVGTIVSDKMDKTVTVNVERLVKHKLYKKYIKKRSKFTAHDNENNCRIGDQVMIVETRPLSRMKRWRVSKIIKKAV